MAGKIDKRLSELGIELPKAAIPVANYVPVTFARGLAFVAGQVTVWNGEFRYIGKLGKEYQIADGQAAARLSRLRACHAPGGRRSSWRYRCRRRRRHR